MARTLIGQLILRMQQNVAPEANKVTAALRGIETASANMDRKRPQWGSKFDQQLQQLKVTPAEHASIVASWNNLLSAINGAGGSNRREGKAAWRTGVLAHLASVRSEIDLTNTRATALGTSLQSLLGMTARFAFGGTLVYGGYQAAHGAVNASFGQQRVEAQGYFAGLPEADQAALKASAEELSAKYGLFVGDMLQALQEAALNMPTTDDALASAETIARLLTSLEPIYGSDGAVSGAYNILKGIDNIGANQTPEEVVKALDGFMRAQQVLGRDFSPEAFKQMLQYARSAGKALDEDFLYTWLPIYASETAGADAGTRLRANFDQLIVGRASAEAEAAQAKYGIRTDETGLIGQDAYAANPTLWAHDYLLPALKDAGVNTEDPIELGRVLGEITNNRQSSDFLAASLVSFTQYLRTATERIPNAKGLGAADEVRDRDPFAAVQGFVNSLQNLSGAVGEHVNPVIVPAFNALAGGIEGLAQKVRDAEGWEVALAGLGVALGGIGAIGVGKVGLAWITAGPSLQTAATMLQKSALALGAGGAVDMPGGGKKGNWWDSLLPAGAGLAIAGAPAVVLHLAEGSPTSTEEYDAQVAEQGEIKRRMWEMLDSFTAGFQPAPTPDSELPDPFSYLPQGGIGGYETIPVDASGVTAAGEEADKSLLKLAALNTTLRPLVDVNPLLRLVSILERAVSLQSKLGTGGGNGGDLAGRVNAAYPDYGVTP